MVFYKQRHNMEFLFIDVLFQENTVIEFTTIAYINLLFIALNTSLFIHKQTLCTLYVMIKNEDMKIMTREKSMWICVCMFRVQLLKSNIWTNAIHNEIYLF